MTTEQAHALSSADQLISLLQRGGTPEDEGAGWSHAARARWIALALRIRSRIVSGQVPDVNIPRVLDADGLLGSPESPRSALNGACLRLSGALGAWRQSLL